MILEAILYFVLGFLIAGLLALMISPAIWNRAVYLTKKKIENSVPLTLNEIQADKDQLRAEFAMSTRRLELSVEELRETAAAQLIEISRKREEAAKYDLESKERLSSIKVLEAKSDELNKKLEIREGQIEDATERLSRLENDYTNARDDLDNTRERLLEADEALNSQRIEIVAKDAEIDGLSDTATMALLGENEKAEKTRERMQTLRGQVARAKDDLANEREKRREAVSAAKAAQKELKELQAKLRKRDRETQFVETPSADHTKQMDDLNKQLLEEKTKTVELEAKIASQALKTEVLLNDATNENVDQAMSEVREELESKKQQVAVLEKQNHELQENLSNITSNASNEWANERQENATLRERINDMAAHIASLSASMEGEASPIPKLVQDAPAEENDAESDVEKPVGSLAERIRAIQATSSSTG